MPGLEDLIKRKRVAFAEHRITRDPVVYGVLPRGILGSYKDWEDPATVVRDVRGYAPNLDPASRAGLEALAQEWETQKKPGVIYVDPNPKKNLKPDTLTHEAMHAFDARALPQGDAQSQSLYEMAPKGIRSYVSERYPNVGHWGGEALAMATERPHNPATWEYLNRVREMIPREKDRIVYDKLLRQAESRPRDYVKEYQHILSNWFSPAPKEIEQYRGEVSRITR